MTDAVIGRMARRDHVLILEFIRHTIAADLAQRQKGDYGRDGIEVGVDVEQLFASVDLLVSRYDQPWSPFVGTWHPGLESFAPTPSLNASSLHGQMNTFERALKQALSSGSRTRTPFSQVDTHGIGRALSDLIQQAIKNARPSDVSTLLAQVREEMLRSLFHILRIEQPSSVSYLMPLVELAQRQGSLTVATLNYDRSVENVADLAGVGCDTLIETWLARGELTPSESGLSLLKLHGSIDWVVEHETPPGKELPTQRIKKVTEDEKPNYSRPAVVFGDAGKLRSEGPYLELLLAWSAELRAATSLVVVGYSFRDQHVNEMIARWFNADPTRRLVLVDPSESGTQTRRSFPWYLAQVNRLAPGETRTGRDRFEHVQGGAGDKLATALELASQ